jgi:uncharacterized protein (DUF1778 family)
VTTHPQPTARRETLNIRIKAAERGLIDRAAELTGKTRTDFILEASRRAAEDTLLDQALLIVSEGAHAEFRARLDAPPKVNPRLQRSLRTLAPWE